MARRAIGPVATALGAHDVLVLERAGNDLRLLGGAGRGASWAGTVEVKSTGETLLRKAKPGKPPVRVEEKSPVRIVGPYWSAHARSAVRADPHQLAGIAHGLPWGRCGRIGYHIGVT